MLINEIIAEARRVVQPVADPINREPDQDPTFDPGSDPDTPAGTTLGSGNSATVKTTADPHTVRKRLHRDDPGYEKFIFGVFEQQFMGDPNPWFPRVDARHDPRDIDSYDLERLFPLDGDNISDAQAWAMLSLALEESDPILRYRTTGSYRVEQFLALCEDIIAYRHPDSIRRIKGDPDLKRALDFIAATIKTDSRFELDLHTKNIMVRLHPLHLVFADPIWTRGGGVGTRRAPF
jgi:hypothetical protein